MLSFQHCCHFVTKKLFVVSSQYMECQYCPGSDLRLILLPLSLPLTPMWLGIQHMIISLWLDIESSLFSSLVINGFLSTLFFNDANMESESENDIFAIFVLWYYIKSKVNGTDFCCKNGAFLWKAFFENCFIESSCTHCFIVILWAVCEYILVVRMMQEDSVKFFYISARMCFYFGEFG